MDSDIFVGPTSIKPPNCTKTRITIKKQILNNEKYGLLIYSSPRGWFEDTLAMQSPVEGQRLDVFPTAGRSTHMGTQTENKRIYVWVVHACLVSYSHKFKWFHSWCGGQLYSPYFIVLPLPLAGVYAHVRHRWHMRDMPRGLLVCRLCSIPTCVFHRAPWIMHLLTCF